MCSYVLVGEILNYCVNLFEFEFYRQYFLVELVMYSSSRYDLHILCRLYEDKIYLIYIIFGFIIIIIIIYQQTIKKL